MQKRVLMLTASAFILACGGIAVSAQQTPGGPMQPPDHQHTQQQPTDHEGRGMLVPAARNVTLSCFCRAYSSTLRTSSTLRAITITLGKRR